MTSDVTFYIPSATLAEVTVIQSCTVVFSQMRKLDTELISYYFNVSRNDDHKIFLKKLQVVDKEKPECLRPFRFYKQKYQTPVGTCLPLSYMGEYGKGVHISQPEY